MATAHKTWPGDATEATVVKCKCGAEFKTFNPRSAFRCPECRVKAKKETAKKAGQKRKIKHRALGTAPE